MVEYQESLDFLFGLQRFGIKLGLDNIRALLDRLGRPESACRLVHVAGTNGKGSVCVTLASILGRCGLRTGLYTSPHLQDFSERIRVDGVPIAPRDVVALTCELRAASAGLQPTFFEFTTAMALLHFQRSGVEVAVLEVGMGGRLDATNVVSPQVTAITPVSLDHQAHLGADLAAIAAEKGGIVKPGIPLILGRQPEAAQAVLNELARQRQAPLRRIDMDFRIEGEGRLRYVGPHLDLDDLELALPGVHQRDNLAVALAAIGELRGQGLALDAAAIRSGVREVRWPGRLEWRMDGQLLLDGAHNGAGAAALANYLQSLNKTGIHLVIGIKGDKQAEAILAPLLPLARKLYCTVPPVEEAVSPTVLAELAADAGRPASIHATPAAALAAAMAARPGEEIVVVAGSLFLVAAVRELLAGGEVTA